MTIYEKAPVEVSLMAGTIIKKFKAHRALEDYGVKIDFLMASPDGDGPALKARGHRVFGKTRKTNLRERTLGHGDAEIVLDAAFWKTANDKTKVALLDHELTHLAVKVKDGLLVTDDQNRPCLTLRHHDVEVGWFAEVAERNGDYSMECLQAKTIFQEFGQLYWPEIAGPKKLNAA